MAHTDKLSPSHYRIIADKIGGRLWDMIKDSPDLERAALEVGESFSLYMLPAEGIQRGTEHRDWPDLQHLVKETGRWHHQIRFGGKGRGFARSIAPPYAPERSSIRELFLSPLAERIDKTIDWLDKHVSEDLVVRLLEVPAYQVYAFWIFDEAKGESRVVNISVGR